MCGSSSAARRGDGCCPPPVDPPARRPRPCLADDLCSPPLDRPWAPGEAGPAKQPAHPSPGSGCCEGASCGPSPSSPAVISSACCSSTTAAPAPVSPSRVGCCPPGPATPSVEEGSDCGDCCSRPTAVRKDVLEAAEPTPAEAACAGDGCCAASPEPSADGSVYDDADACSAPCCGPAVACEEEEPSAGGGCGGCCSDSSSCAPEEGAACAREREPQGCADACCDGSDASTDDDDGYQAACQSKTEGLDDEDDDTLCPCCVRLLVATPQAFGLSLEESLASGLFPVALPDTPKPVSTPLSDALDGLTGTLRRCCRLLESACAQKACCFVPSSSRRPRKAVAPVASACLQPKEEKLDDAAAAEDEGPPAGTEALTLEIRGMDCIDCLPKVDRALSRLPSVKPLGLDYLSGLANLVYDAEALAPDAIARYVARATGFDVRVLGTQTERDASVVVLPVRFAAAPPAHVLEALDVRHRTELGGFEQIAFPVRGEHAQQPRDVLARLEPFVPTLLPATALEDVDDRVAQDLRRVALRTLAACTLSVPVLVFAWAPLPGRPLAYGAASVVLTTLIQIVGFPLVSASVRSLVYLREADMGVLVAVSTLTAYVFSLVAFAFEAAGRRFTEPFFETTALLVSLIYLGRLVQATSRRSASSALRALQELQSGEVVLVETAGKERVERSLDARLLHYGDVLHIRPDTLIPTDGLVVRGASEVDQSSATGESLPSAKSAGSAVIAGTVNLNGSLDIQVSTLVHENSLARVSGLVRQAQASKSRFQDVADRVSAVILPIAAAVALISFVVWILVGRFVRSNSNSASVVAALTYALSVLIVSCPCAIGLAVPLVVASAMRAGLREGVLFRSSEALQSASSVDVVAFDKTGTLSRGSFSLSRSDILVRGVEGLVADLTSTNGHPISKAVHAHVEPLANAKTARPAPSGIVSLPGMGVKAVLAGYPLLGGAPKFTGAVDLPHVRELTALGLTLFVVTLGGELVAAFGLADVARPESSALVADLVRRGKQVVVLSGDNAGAVERFARSIGLPPTDARASFSPADKADFIASLQQQGRRVAFVGDGTNDGPALAQADLSLSIGSGSDVAVAASSAVILGSDLRRSVVGALDLATHARWQIAAALGWCALYFAFAILLASGAFVRFRIEPQWAGLGELVSVLPVVAVGLGLDVHWRWRSARVRG